MQADNRLLDDMARLASGALGAFSGFRSEIEALIRQRLERLLADMELVGREEFEAVKALAANARNGQEAQSERIARLETALATAGIAIPDTADEPHKS